MTALGASRQAAAFPTPGFLIGCGVSGAALGLLADIVMLWQPGSVADMQALGFGIIDAIPRDRARLGGILGVPAFFLQAVGIVGLCLCLRRTHDAIGVLSVSVAGLLSFAMVAFVAWHVSYPFMGLVRGLESDAIAETAHAALIEDTTGLLTDFITLTSAAMVAGFAGFALLCAMGWSQFPRWFALISPMLIGPLLITLAPYLPDAVGVAVLAAGPNVALLLFFGAALVLRRPADG